MTQTVGQEIDNAVYHKLPGVSYSGLQVFRDDPRKYHDRYILGNYDRERKDYFDFGSAVHEIALLGKSASVKLIPEAVLSKSGSKAGAAWKEFEAEHADFLLLKQPEFDSVMRCVDAIYAHPLASKLLVCDGQPEQMYAYEDKTLELRLKCKPDKPCFTPQGLFICDIKTTDSTSDAGFVASIENYHYYHQAYFYRKVMRGCGLEVEDFFFIAVGKSRPHCVSVFSLDDEYYEAAKEDVENALLDLAERHRSGIWHPYNWDKARRLKPRNFLRYRNEYK